MKIIQNKIVILVLGVIFGYYAKGLISLLFPSNFDIAAKKLERVLYLTDNYYVDKLNLDSLTENAINGLISQLDPHTIYLPPQEHLSTAEEMSGKFFGIGIEFTMLNDTLNVVTVIPNGPSDKVGILPGDKIIKVNNKSIIKTKNDKVISLLRGEEGDKLNLTIKRTSFNDTINFIVKREEIILHAVEFSDIINDSIGYIKLVRFSENAESEMIDAVLDLSKKGAKSILLDLRNNPGGYLDQAVKITDLFLGGQKLVVTTKSRISNLDESYYTNKSFIGDKLPLIVLINYGSASASEIVSGALQDWDRAVIAGEKSFGKGLVQQSFVLDDNSELRLTLAKYYLPSNRLIQKVYSDKKKYYEIDSLNADSLAPSKPFYTKKGRKVYENGGITPDKIIPLRQYSLSFLISLKNNAFYTFIQKEYLTNIKELNKKYSNNFKYFNNNFNIDDKLFFDFVNYSKNIDQKVNISELKEEKSLIISRLKAEVALLVFGRKGWYKQSILSDSQIQEALKIFPFSSRILNNEKF